MIQSDDLAAVITAIAGLVTVIGGVVMQIWLTLRQNKTLASNHQETLDAVENGPRQP